MALNSLCRTTLLAVLNRWSRCNLATGALTDSLPEEEDTIRKNPYFQKYQKKIDSLRKERTDDYLTRLTKSTKKPQVKETEEPRPKLTPKLEKMKTISSTPLLRAKTLNEIVKLELLEMKSTDEIKRIWREFHKNIDGLSAVIPADIFRLILERSKTYPIFLLPLPRKEGYEFIVCQFEKTEVHFTQLFAWQSYKENAPICMSMIYYPDLVDTKEIAPMRGTYDRATLSLLEAQCLANTLHLYYGEDNPGRTELLDRFTHDPDNFKHMDLIKEIEKLSVKTVKK